MNPALSLTKITLADLDAKSATSALKAALTSVDDAAQKIAPLVGMLRYQARLKEVDLNKITASFPSDSLAGSTLRNCKVYEDCWREYVLKGLLSEDSYHALSFAGCRDLLAANKLVIASTRNKKTCAVEAQREALQAGKSAAEVLKAVKQSDKKTVQAENKAEKEREATRAANAIAAKQDREAFQAFKASPPATASASPPAPTPDNAGDMTRLFMELMNTLKPKQRALMPDMLRAMAERLEQDAQESAPPSNIVELKKAA
jgi:hypothetical protein